MKLSELSERLGCRLEGDGDLEIVRAAGLERAGPDAVSFFANNRYAAALKATRAGAVILGNEAPAAPCAMLRSAHPYVTFADAVALFAPADRPEPGISPQSAVAADALIGPDVSVAPFVTIGAGACIGARTVIAPFVSVGPGARVGEDCWLHSHVAIRERVVVGNRVVLQDGAVIGSDGYGFARRPDGTHQKIPQTGTVIVEDDVEIGANATIDRPAVGETRIGAGSKIDNLVQVAHGVAIGRNVLLAAQVGIAGSSTIEEDVVLGGQVGVAGHITIGHGVAATAQSGITNSVEPKRFVSGSPAFDNRDWRKASVVFKRLPELRKAVLLFERRLAEVEARLGVAGDDVG